MDQNSRLIDAAKTGDVHAAKNALRLGDDVNGSIDGWTALFWAAQEGYAELVDLLLDAGADVNYADPGGFTPLKQSVGECHLHVVERLILRGADVNYRCASDGGCTALHTAAAHGRIECIRLLLLYGADRNAQNDAGQTPYKIAIENGEMEAAGILN